MNTLDKARKNSAEIARPKGPKVVQPNHPPPPAAGAHAARHLTNEDATPGSGALTSHSHASGKEVDGGAG